MNKAARKPENTTAVESRLRGLLWLLAGVLFVIVVIGPPLRQWVQTAQSVRKRALQAAEDSRAISVRRSAREAARKGDDAAYILAVSRLTSDKTVLGYLFSDLASDGNTHALDIW